MPRPETDIAATRSRIIAAADQMIQDKGAISFTMTDLASSVGSVDIVLASAFFIVSAP